MSNLSAVLDGFSSAFVRYVGIILDAGTFHHRSGADTMDRQDTHSYTDSDRNKRHTKTHETMHTVSWVLVEFLPMF
jgi:hypothetical protein